MEKSKNMRSSKNKFIIFAKNLTFYYAQLEICDLDQWWMDKNQPTKLSTLLASNDVCNLALS